MTCSANYVLLLGTISPAGLALHFQPQTGYLVTFDMSLSGPDPSSIPCELTGALASHCATLRPGTLVLLTGGLAVRDADLGEDTGRLVVVGTALTVVQDGEELP